MTQTFDIAGFTVTIGGVVAAVVVLQWLVMMAATALSSEKPPKKGLLRSADVRLIISTAVFAIAWIAVFIIGGKESKATAAEIVSRAHGTCSSITTDMAANVVRQKLGTPDEVRSDEATRGPGAAIWVYRDSRCAVHIFDEKVEFID